MVQTLTGNSFNNMTHTVLFYYACLFRHRVCVTVHEWGLEVNFQGSDLSFCHVGSGVKLRSSGLEAVEHLTSPIIFFETERHVSQASLGLSV